MDIKLESVYVARVRGKGAGKHYTPWLEIKDDPSRGEATQVKVWKTGRTHHLLSDLEFNHFLLLEWDNVVTDIPDSFPAP